MVNKLYSWWTQSWKNRSSLLIGPNLLFISRLKCSVGQSVSFIINLTSWVHIRNGLNNHEFIKLQLPLWFPSIWAVSTKFSLNSIGRRSTYFKLASYRVNMPLMTSHYAVAGEIVVTETPYSSILLPEYYNSHCQTCYYRMIAPIPCWCCAKVRNKLGHSVKYGPTNFD